MEPETKVETMTDEMILDTYLDECELVLSELNNQQIRELMGLARLDVLEALEIWLQKEEGNPDPESWALASLTGDVVAARLKDHLTMLRKQVTNTPLQSSGE